MRVVIFAHSIASDWNHGNAHFLRGICRELRARQADVAVYEPRDAWSVQNLIASQGVEAVDGWLSAYPDLEGVRHVYDADTLDLDVALEGADLVIVHEWNPHDLVRRVGEHRAAGGGPAEGRYALLFHDTHHRSVTAPEDMAAYDLRHYDGVLAFGEAISEVYRREGWAQQVWTWHEAADARLFEPIDLGPRRSDLVWIGNWGDGERSAELHEFLIDPVIALGLRARVHGVRYPADALATLKHAGITYAGWLPNYLVPQAFAAHAVTVHVPRGPYTRALPGIPTIRVFEALACGIPLISAPWDDTESLFTPGADYLVAEDGTAMREHLRHVLSDETFARALAERGRATILARHICTHRVDELLSIAGSLGVKPVLASPDSLP